MQLIEFALIQRRQKVCVRCYKDGKKSHPWFYVDIPVKNYLPNLIFQVDRIKICPHLPECCYKVFLIIEKIHFIPLSIKFEKSFRQHFQATKNSN